jgi:nitrite reductase (NADH) small subunit
MSVADASRPGLVDVGPEEAFVEARPSVVNANGRDLCVVRWRGGMYAIRPTCPHQFGPIPKGAVRPRLVCPDGTPDAMGLDESAPVIVCPWHHWEFDLRTGRATWGDDAPAVRSYPVTINDGRVLIDLSPSRRQPA